MPFFVPCFFIFSFPPELHVGPHSFRFSTLFAPLIEKEKKIPGKKQREWQEGKKRAQKRVQKRATVNNPNSPFSHLFTPFFCSFRSPAQRAGSVGHCRCESRCSGRVIRVNDVVVQLINIHDERCLKKNILRKFSRVIGGREMGVESLIGELGLLMPATSQSLRIDSVLLQVLNLHFLAII
jgi:hypothetical protein